MWTYGRWLLIAGCIIGAYILGREMERDRQAIIGESATKAVSSTGGKVDMMTSFLTSPLLGRPYPRSGAKDTK